MGYRDESSAITNCPDGGFIVVGDRLSADRGDDILAFKVNSKGRIVWNRTYGGAGRDQACGVLECDEGYLIAGTTTSFGPHGQIYLVRIDEHGTMLWNRTYEGGWHGCRATAIARIESGFIVAGVTSGDIYLLRIDAEASPVWNRTYRGPDQEIAYDVLPCTDGGFLVTGESLGLGDIYVLKLDAQGNKTWETRPGTGYFDRGYSAAEDPDGGYLIVGETLVLGGLHYEMYLVKIDPLGQVIWNRTKKRGWDCRGHDILPCQDGGFYVAGSEGLDLVLYRVNERGETTWRRRFRGKCWYPPTAVGTEEGGLAVASTMKPYGFGFCIHLVRMTRRRASLLYRLLPLILTVVAILPATIIIHRKGWLAGALSWATAPKQPIRPVPRTADAMVAVPESSVARIKALFLEIVGFFVPIFQFIPAVGIYAGIMSLPLIAYFLSYSLLPDLWRQIQFMFLDFRFMFWQPVWEVPLRTLLPILLRKSLVLGGLAFLLVSVAYRLRHRRGLVTTGPYRLVRHPQYLGIIAMTFGMNLFILDTNPIFPIGPSTTLEFETSFILYVWVAQVIAYLILGKIEDWHLTKTFGPSHQQYKESVPFIIPFLRLPNPPR